MGRGRRKLGVCERGRRREKVKSVRMGRVKGVECKEGEQKVIGYLHNQRLQ